MHPISLVSDADFDDMVRNVPNRTTIKDFTEEIDETRFVRQYNFSPSLMRILCLCLVLLNLLHSVALPSSSLGDHCDFNTTLGREFGQIVTRRRSSPWRLLLWTTSHSLDTRSTWTLMRRPWSQTRLLRRRETQEYIQIPWKWSNDTRNWIAWVIRRRPLERTEHLTTHGNQLRMTMRGLRWDKVTCLQRHLNELPIREFEKTEQYRTSDRTRKRCTVPPPKTPTQWHGLTFAEVSSHNPSGKQAKTLISITCRRINAASSWTTSVLSAGRVNFGKLRILISRFFSNERFNVTNDPHLSLLTEFWWNNYAHVILTAEADSLPTDAQELLHDYGLVGCHSSRSSDLLIHARIDSSRYTRLMWEW